MLYSSVCVLKTASNQQCTPIQAAFMLSSNQQNKIARYLSRGSIAICSPEPLPLEERLIQHMFEVCQVVLQCGKNGGCDCTLLPFITAAHLAEQLQEGCVSKNGVDQQRCGCLGNSKKASTLLLNVQQTLWTKPLSKASASDRTCRVPSATTLQALMPPHFS